MQGKPHKSRAARLKELLGEDDCQPANGREAMNRAMEDGHAIKDALPGRSDGACSKTYFTSEKQARKAALNRMRKGANVDRLRTYLCPACHFWHLSSTFYHKTNQT